MLNSNQKENLKQFLGFIDKIENEGSSHMFLELYGCGVNEAKILSIAPFLTNTITQILEDDKASLV